MKKKNIQVSVNSGCGFWFLGILFVILKLCGIINWAWVWVLAPIWGSVAIALVILVIGLIFILIGAILNR